MHLHDNRGPADAGDPHLPLGRGVVDARAVLRAARASGATVILELLDEAAIRESIAHLDARGLLDDAHGAPRPFAGRARPKRPVETSNANPKPAPWYSKGTSGLPGTSACASPWYSRGATSLGPSA